MGSELKRARLARGLTQKSLADALGISPSRLSRWEAGSAAIPPEDQARLRELLDLDEDGSSSEPLDAPTEATASPSGFRGRPRSSRTPVADFGSLNSRVDLVNLLSHLFQCPADEAELLIHLAIDDGPISMRATIETAIISLALVAKSVVTDPKKPSEIYPVYMEHASYPTPPQTPSHRPQKSDTTPDGQGQFPLGVPVGIPETILRFSFSNNRLAVPAVGGPNHERAAMVVITNLAYQIWAASGVL